jgi:hypothetical protein
MAKSITSAEAAILEISNLNPITAAIVGLYHIGSSVNDFINEHIEDLKLSANHIISSTGRVLEGAKFGFGLGYLTSVAIISVGQLILGNNLLVGTIAAVKTVGSAAILANPVAMTCGAIGAICYGWAALTDQEKDVILNRVQTGLEIGVELIKSLIEFVTRKMKEFLSSEQFKELKIVVAGVADAFGKKISDITKVLSDIFSDGKKRVFVAFTRAAEKVGDIAAQKADSAMSASKKAADAASQTAEKVGDLAGQATNSAVDAFKAAAGSVKQAASTISDAASEIPKTVSGKIKDVFGDKQ